MSRPAKKPDGRMGFLVQGFLMIFPFYLSPHQRAWLVFFSFFFTCLVFLTFRSDPLFQASGSRSNARLRLTPFPLPVSPLLHKQNTRSTLFLFHSSLLNAGPVLFPLQRLSSHTQRRLSGHTRPQTVFRILCLQRPLQPRPSQIGPQVSIQKALTRLW